MADRRAAHLTSMAFDGPSSFSMGRNTGARSTFVLHRKAPVNPLKFRYELSQKQKVDMKEAFTIFDSERSGMIHLQSMRVAMRALGVELRKKQVRELMQYVKTDSEMLSFNDFLHLMTLKMFEKDTVDELKKSFALLGNHGKVCAATLRKVADEIGEEMTDEEIAEMIAVADRNDDGFVELDDFLAYIKNNYVEGFVPKIYTRC